MNQREMRELKDRLNATQRELKQYRIPMLDMSQEAHV